MPFHAARRSRFVFSFAAILGLSLLAPALVAGTPAGALSGRVTADGKPAAGARVRLYLDDTQAKPRAYRELKSAETGDDGAYEFAGLPKGWYLLVAERDGSAKTFHYVVMEEEAKLSNDFALRRPVSSALLIRDEAGKPIAGARLRTLNPRDENGEFWARSRGDWKTFGQTAAPSDESGRLRLPSLPEKSVVTAIIDHPDFAPAEVKDAAVGPPVAAEVVMKPGAAVALKIAPGPAGKTISDAEIDLRHDPFSSPSTVIVHRLPIDAQGTARLTVEPGRYTLLRLTHEDYFILPEYLPDISKGEYLRIGDSANDEFRFHLRPKVKVRGRVIDASTGRPLAGQYVYGEIPNHEPGTPASDRPAGAPDEWSIVSAATTDESGDYSLELAAGPARVTFNGEGYVGEARRLEFTVAADGSTAAPDMRLRPMPKIAGIVRDPQGRPAAKVVVRLRGGLSYMAPVLTDERGRFELALGRIPRDRDTEEPRPVQPLVAFHPYQRLSARADVDLNDPDSLKDVTLTLSPHAPGALIADFADELTPWQRGEIDPERAAEMQAATLRGKPAPPLDGTWLNIEKPKDGLASFRGKYVLLDFWFIGCGPCHGDFPSVQKLHDLYKDKGLVVIAVHDNSETAEAVRAFAERQGMNVPILVDEPDGRTTARYEGHGLSGYPSHILIAPDGTVADDDTTTPGPSLRTYKIELIRELLLDRNADK
jgi:thiol-disulfide isomerase/thioredoxin